MPVRPEDDRLAIKHGVVEGQGAHRLRDSREGVAVIGRVAGPENDSVRVFQRNQPMAVEFNLVNPLRARSRGCREQRTSRAGQSR
jgi:hypothetical protein